MARYHHDGDARIRAAGLASAAGVLELQVHAPAELGPLFDRLEDLMGILGYPHKDILAVQLVLDEAATNAFRHGNRGDRAKAITIRYMATAAQMLLEVEDEGAGFDPGRVPSLLAEENRLRPTGCGLMLMRAFATWVTFSPKGNRVTFARQRSVT
jgi:anti-sigma regulatory factor (Ser/Thr protein kinase)